MLAGCDGARCASNADCADGEVCLVRDGRATCQALAPTSGRARRDAGDVEPDGGAVDGGANDGGASDGGAEDGGPHDAGAHDAGDPDVGTDGGGAPDAGRDDAGPSGDAGPIVDGGLVLVDAGPDPDVDAGSEPHTGAVRVERSRIEPGGAGLLRGDSFRLRGHVTGIDPPLTLRGNRLTLQPNGP